MKNIICLSILVLAVFITNAQEEDLIVPKEVLNELTLKIVEYRGRNFKYKVKYPKKYSKNKTYKVFLALAGGRQGEAEVDYCYYAWFRSSYFDDYIVIMPINTEEESLRDYGNEEVLEFYDMIVDNEKVTKSKWIIGGTSNGGVAAFNYLMAYSSFFEGAIFMPGMISNKTIIPKHWKGLKIILSYGEFDDAWKELANEAFNHLSHTVKNIKLFEMKGQGHLVLPTYDIDNVYKQYFEK